MPPAKEFYRAFEERHRGSRELIKSRLEIYMPFIAAVIGPERGEPALDLGCGRGEWLELLQASGLAVRGVDLDSGMLDACRERDLPAEKGDALVQLEILSPATHAVISAFHLIEHLPFERLSELVANAYRALRPGGVLILETPNPENFHVGAHTFHLDPTHTKPLPPLLLSFLCEFHGFEQVTLLRLQARSGLAEDPSPSLVEVLTGASPDYAILARKKSSEPDPEWDRLIAVPLGVDLTTLAARHQSHLDQITGQFDAVQRSHQQQLRGAEKALQSIDIHIGALANAQQTLATNLASQTQDIARLNTELAHNINMIIEQARSNYAEIASIQNKQAKHLEAGLSSLRNELHALHRQALGKMYSNVRVPWHTHLYRAGVSLFIRSEKPWHTHVYRAARSITGDIRYKRSPNNSRPPSPQATTPHSPENLKERVKSLRENLADREKIAAQIPHQSEK